MLLKRVIGLVFAGGLAFSAFGGHVVVVIAPPHAQYEQRPSHPHGNYVWVSGYHRWDGHAYVWSGGRWEQPPRGHSHWQSHHWAHEKGGWVLVEGHWR